MIYRGPGFLAVVWFGSSPSPFPVCQFDWRHTGRLRKRENFLTRVGEGWGEEPNSEKAWFSVNGSVLSGIEEEDVHVHV